MTRTFNESPQPTAGWVYTNAYFRIEPCVTCFVPGYLIVAPQPPAASLSGLQHGALACLGPTLAAATRAIEDVIRPERVYCALFAEETRSLHFHLFPRTAWLLSQYAAVHPADRGISGPRLLDWARRTFHRPISTDYIETMQGIFRELAAASRAIQELVQVIELRRVFGHDVIHGMRAAQSIPSLTRGTRNRCPR